MSTIVGDTELKPFSLADIYAKAANLQTTQQQQQMRQMQMDALRDKTARDANARQSLSDLILSPASPYASQGGANGPARSPAWQNYVQADPDGAMDYAKQTEGWTADHFKHARNLNSAVLGILGSVYDQGSYDRAKQQARALYGRYGVNLDDFNLPDQYSPDLVHGLQMQALDTKQQLMQVDREQDNQRQDRNTDSMITTREERVDEARRYHNQADATRRRGQDVAASTARRGQDVRGAGHSGGRSGGAARPTATGPNGQKLEFDGKAWVPVR